MAMRGTVGPRPAQIPTLIMILNRPGSRHMQAPAGFKLQADADFQGTLMSIAIEGGREAGVPAWTEQVA